MVPGEKWLVPCSMSMFPNTGRATPCQRGKDNRWVGYDFPSSNTVMSKMLCFTLSGGVVTPPFRDFFLRTENKREAKTLSIAVPLSLFESSAPNHKGAGTAKRGHKRRDHPSRNQMGSSHKSR